MGETFVPLTAPLDGAVPAARRGPLLVGAVSFVFLVSAAAAHGAFRRAQRCAKRVVSDDFAMLRLAFHVALRRSGKSRPRARDVFRELLPDWRMARGAARDGYVVDRSRRRKEP